ncbi:hypothetical protein BC828DRAFT_386979 [Blastocladiella britannica]|nr:hypothetical protein BC828DRAFT_386979 [Blastocladiella britannica]
MDHHHQHDDGWTSCIDPDSGDRYFWNHLTNETTWTNPYLGEDGHGTPSSSSAPTKAASGVSDLSAIHPSRRANFGDDGTTTRSTSTSHISTVTSSNPAAASTGHGFSSRAHASAASHLDRLLSAIDAANSTSGGDQADATTTAQALLADADAVGTVPSSSVIRAVPTTTSLPPPVPLAVPQAPVHMPMPLPSGSTSSSSTQAAYLGSAAGAGGGGPRNVNNYFDEDAYQEEANQRRQLVAEGIVEDKLSSYNG